MFAPIRLATLAVSLLALAGCSIQVSGKDGADGRDGAGEVSSPWITI